MRPSRLALLLLAGLAAFLFLLAVAPSAQAACVSAPRTFEIDDDYPAPNAAACQYQNLNQTMALGPLWGDTYIIHNGTYYLNYVLSVGGTSWIGDSQTGVIIRRAATGTAPYGALETRGSYTNLTNLTFESNVWAIVIDYNSGESGSSNNRITNLTLNATNGYGCVCWGPNLLALNITSNSYYGLHLYSSNPVVRNFQFNGVNSNGVGLPLYGQNFTIDGVQMGGSFSTGIDSSGAYGTISNFTSNGGYDGIRLSGMSAPTFLSNLSISNANSLGFSVDYSQIFVDGLNITKASNFGLYHYGGGMPASNYTNVSVTAVGDVGLYFDWYSAVNLKNIYGDGGQRGLYMYQSSVEAYNVTLTNWDWNPIQGEGDSFLNLTQAYLLGGNDDIWWPSGLELWVTDTVMDKSSVGGIAYQTTATLRFTNVTIINQPRWGVHCSPCGTVYWNGGAVNNTPYGLYADSNSVSYQVSHVAFSNMSATALAAFDYPSLAPHTIDNSTFTFVYNAIELAFTTSMLVENNVFTDVTVNGIWFFEGQYARFYNNTMTRVLDPIVFDPGYAVDGYSLHDIPTSNTVDGKPIYYLLNASNFTVPTNAALVYLINSTNITVQGINGSTGRFGVMAVVSTNVTIADSRLWGINTHLVGRYADGLTVRNVTGVGTNTYQGIWTFAANDFAVDRFIMYNMYMAGTVLSAYNFQNSTFSEIFGNNIDALVSLGDCFDVSVSNSAAANISGQGTYAENCHRISFSNVTLIGPNEGMYDRLSTNVSYIDTLVVNATNVAYFTIQSSFTSYLRAKSNGPNAVGLVGYLADNMTCVNCEMASYWGEGAILDTVTDYRATDSTFVSAASNALIVFSAAPRMLHYHNNFYSPYGIYLSASQGTWDFSHPTGGNYYNWAISGFTDNFSGASKTGPGKDGIADQNYTVYGSARDFYPLMDPWPPGIQLTSPANGSVIRAGTPLNFSISNFFNTVSWNDSFAGNSSTLAYPHDINTSGWPDGIHTLAIDATDNVAPRAFASFTFDFDSSGPVITATPTLGTTDIALGTRITISITDAHFDTSLYIVDGSSMFIGAPPFNIDTSTWSRGAHSILIMANDTINNTAIYNWSFYLDDRAPTLTFQQPVGVLFMQPGVQITYAASDERTLLDVMYGAVGQNSSQTYAGAYMSNASAWSVDTTGWESGCYFVTTTARDAALHTSIDSRQFCVDGDGPDFTGLDPEFYADEDVPYTFPGWQITDLDWTLTYLWEFDTDNLLAPVALTGQEPTFTFDTPGNYNVHITVTDRAGNVEEADVTIFVWDSTPPTPSADVAIAVDEDTELTFDASSSSDNDGYWAGGSSGNFTWTVAGPWVGGAPLDTVEFYEMNVAWTFDTPGNYTYTLTVTDRSGNPATVNGNFTVVDVTNPTAVITGPVAIINEGQSAAFDGSTSTDNDPASALGFTWTFTYGGSPRTVTGALFNFTFANPGTYAITLTVADAAGNSGSQVVVQRVNDMPEISNSPLLEAVAGQSYGWTATVADTDTGDGKNFTFHGPAGMSISSSGALTWTPAANAYGVYNIDVTVTDGFASDTVTFVLTVRRDSVTNNHAPGFTSFPAQEGSPGGTYTYAVAFSDPDTDDRLTLAIANGPAGMALDSSNTLRWSVPSNAANDATFNVSLVVSDGLIDAYQNFTIRVRGSDQAATFVSGQIPATITLGADGTAVVLLGPGVAIDNDDAYAALTFYARVSQGDSVQVRIGKTEDGTTALFITGLKPGTSTIQLKVADPSGKGQSMDIAATYAPAAVGGGFDPMLLLLLAAAGGLGVVGLVLVRRRKGDGEEVPVAPPTPPAATKPAGPAVSAPAKPAAAEDVTAEVLQVSVPSKPPASSAVGAIGMGAAAAAATAAGAAAIAPAKPSKAATYTIEGLFIIYQDGRMIYSKTDLGAESLGDPELVSSMFTAVTQFIKDSFSASGELNKMGYGDNQILIERGQYTYMATITFGEPDKDLQEAMSTAIEKIEYSYAGVIEAWDGQTNRFKDIDQVVLPVLALTAGVTRGDVLAATTTRDVKVLSQLEFFQGFVRLKVGVKNDTEAVITKVTLDIDYNEDVLRLQRIEPATYKTSGARVMLNVLNPGEKSSVAFYFDPQICTETNIDGIVRYRDYKGVLQSVTMKTRKAEVVCPLFFTKEHANTAMLKRLIETELMERDSKIYTITKIPPYVKHKDVFDVCKQVVLSHDVHMVREFVTYNPFSGEAWFYGETKVKGYKIVIRTAVREDNTIEFFAASSVIKAVTGLLAEFNHTLTSMIVERYSDVKIEQIYDEGKKHEIQAKSLIDKLGEGEAGAGETDQGRR